MDDTCPVCRTAEIVCAKWTLLLIRDLSEGRSRFCELERSLQGISPRTLSLRLRALEEEGIVERDTFPEVPPRVEYQLTEKGRALLPAPDRFFGQEQEGGPEHLALHLEQVGIYLGDQAEVRLDDAPKLLLDLIQPGAKRIL